MLETLPPQALPWGVFWVGRKEPEGTLRSWLDQRHAIWVENDDFDELMFLVKQIFMFPDPDPNWIENAFRICRQTHDAVSKRMIMLAANTDREVGSLK
jgi:hypothetical protein